MKIGEVLCLNRARHPGEVCGRESKYRAHNEVMPNRCVEKSTLMCQQGKASKVQARTLTWVSVAPTAYIVRNQQVSYLGRYSTDDVLGVDRLEKTLASAGVIAGSALEKGRGRCVAMFRFPAQPWESKVGLAPWDFEELPLQEDYPCNRTYNYALCNFYYRIVSDPGSQVGRRITVPLWEILITANVPSLTSSTTLP